MTTRRVVGLCLVLALFCTAAPAWAKQVTLTFGWWGNAAVAKDYQVVFDRFQELNPDIKIEGIHWGFSAAATEKFTVGVATDTAPDVFMIPTVIPEALLPLDSYLARSPGLARQLIPDGLQYWRLSMDNLGRIIRGSGKQLGLPIYSYATAIAYNQTMFAELGINNPKDWTYAEYEEIAKKLTRDISGDGVTDIWGAAWHLQSNTGLGPVVAAFGDWPLNISNPPDTRIDSPSVRPGLEVIRRWMQELRIHRTPKQGFNTDFAGQKVATVQGHNDTFLSYPGAIGDRFAWDLAPMPVGPNGRKSVAFHQGIGINAKTPYKDEAWRFIEFLLSNEGAKLSNQSIIRLTANLSAAQNYIERSPFSAGVIFESFDYRIEESPGFGVNEATELYPVWNGEESVVAATERIARSVRARIAEMLSRSN